MSWSGWGTRLNVTSIVSQGLEQVSKLREDVEKQFDQVVTGANGLRVPSSGSVSTRTTSTDDATASPPSDATNRPTAASVDDIGVSPPLSAFGKDVLANLRLQQPPPASADGKRRLGGVLATGSSSAEGTRSPLFVEDKPMSGEHDGVKEEGVDEDNEGGCTGEEGEKEELEEKLAVENVESLASRDANETEDTVEESVDAESKQEAGSDTFNEQEAEEAKPTVVDQPLIASSDDVIDSEAEAEAQHTAVKSEEIADEKEEDKAAGREASEGEDTTDSNDREAGSHDSVKGDEPSSATSEADAALIQSLRRELQHREAQLLATSSTIAELHNELDKTCQREVAAVERSRHLSDQLERLRVEVEQQAASMPRPSELQALQYELGDKDAQLKALLAEGHALSVKQSQYEQRLRVLRKEKDEEEERRLKFQTHSEALAVQLQDVAAKLKASEDAGKALAKEVKDLQSNAQSTQTKLLKAEQDATAATMQLETAQAQVQALSVDNEAMKSQLDALKGTSQSHEVLTVEKQEMQRTVEYLQHRIRELEDELARREESSRVEMHSMKKKWLDAAARVDMMGQSVSEATQPLLQQMNALREELRARQDGWKATETALVARLEDSNELRLTLEQEKIEAEQHVHSLQAKIDALQREGLTKQAELIREKERLELALQDARELRSQVDATRIELDETKVKLDDETHAKQQLMARVNADRLKKRELPERSDSTGGSESSNLELVEAREREEQLRTELERSQSELLEVKALLEANGVASRTHRGLSTSSRDGSSHEAGDSDAPGGNNGSLVTQASILKSTLESPSDTSAVFGASTTVLGLSQLQQRLRLVEGEKRMLKQQLTALEAKQKQNTDDIVRLSTRNALLETKETELHQAQHELVQLKQRQQVLLELFGEKEEQVEELQAEVGELKAFYRKQLDTLAGQQR